MNGRDVSFRRPLALIQRNRLPAPQRRPELIELTGVQNVAGLEPASPCLIDGITHKAELVRTVGIGRQYQLDADLLGQFGVPFVEVEPVRLPVDLDRAAARARGAQNALDIEVIALPLADQPPGRVRQHREVGIVECPQ